MFKMKKTSFMVRCALHTPAMVLFLVTAGSARGELPVAAGAWSSNPNVRMTMPSVNHMLIDQTGNGSANWVLNWQSFDISAGNRVQFIQPSSNHIALNRITGAQSVIRGQIDANGRIYLLNRNGFLFGSGSVINVNSLVASSLALNISDEDFINNNVNLLNVIDNGGAAFTGGAGAGPVTIEAGASMYMAGGVNTHGILDTVLDDGSTVLIIAPEIINGGDITTKSGQVILAASTDSVYLTPSNDPALRGFLVEVGGVGGDVNNVGNILAERGNITLAGLAIHQSGALTATTAINENGSIRLLARDMAGVAAVETTVDDLVLGINTDQRDVSGNSTRRDNYRVATHSGEVVLGENSTIVITPDKSDNTLAVDDPTGDDAPIIPRSRVELTGHDITLLSNASITATGGEVMLHATAEPSQAAINAIGNLNTKNDSVISLAAGSRIDVSGTTDTRVEMARNQLEIQLTGDFLRDAPLQRDAELHGERVNVDIRKGTPLGDISKDVAANIKRDINERLSTGGSVQLLSQGGVTLADDSMIDIAGGAVNYNAGFISTSQLVTAQGQVVAIADARIDLNYTGLFGQLTLHSARWGSAADRSWTAFSRNNGSSRYYDAYTEGRDAGSLSIQAHAVAGMSDIVAGSQVSLDARQINRAGYTSGGSLDIQLGNATVTGPAQQVIIGDNLAADIAADAMQNWLASGDTTPAFALQMTDSNLSRSGLSDVLIKTRGDISVADSADVKLAAGGSLALQGGAVSMDGDITIAGGAVDLRAMGADLNSDGTLEGNVSANGRIDVSGNWVSDNVKLAQLNGTTVDLTQAVALHGGSINITSDYGDLNLGEQSDLRANGGAWLQTDGKLRQGDAGNIALKVANADADTKLNMNGSMQAFALGRGGKLDITANHIAMGDFDGLGVLGDVTADNLTRLTPALFTYGGFADYAITANKGDLTVLANTEITPLTKSLVLNNDYSIHQTGDNLLNFTSKQLLPEYARKAGSLSLTANLKAVSNQALGADQSLRIEQGAHINMDTGSSVNLGTDSRMHMAGAITAHGGNVSLTLSNEAGQSDYVADQAIWVDGAIDVSGEFVAGAPNDAGLLTGTLYNGGQINLNANRGYVITSDASELDVSGTHHDIDLPSQVSGSTVLSWSRQPVSAAAGDINIDVAEGFWLGGQLLGEAPDSHTAAGGLHLAIASDRQGTNSLDLTGSNEARVLNLVLAQDALPESPLSATAVPATMKGQGWVSVETIAQGGFDELGLRVKKTTGAVQFHNDIDMSLGRSLKIEAPRLVGDGAISLAAPYIYLGSEFAGTALATRGSGVLNINASGLLDVYGRNVMQGINEVNLHSDGDVRALGNFADNVVVGNFELTGSFETAGNLNLDATQFYASTLSQFEFSAGDTLNVTRHGDDSPVLSAGSVLTFSADTINQHGTVKAPMGEIIFNAVSELNLLPDSLTSVSAENQLIPFGYTSGQQSWYYFQDHLITAPPEKHIKLNADTINLADGAVLDVSGGGDLYAWEHVPGSGGSTDTLLQANAAGAFAVMPGFAGYAPNDFYLDRNVTHLNAGDQIYLSASDQLTAGLYTLLPARYALLPGARLVTPTGGRMVAGQSYHQVDGSPVVAGQMRVANTGLHDSLWTGYLVENGDVVRGRSKYFEPRASQFFRDAAAHNNSQLPAMPEDAGSLDILAASRLQLDGLLQGAAADVDYVDELGDNQLATGRSSQANIAGDNLRVVNAYDTNDGIQLLDTSLNDFGAASLLLGGVRTHTADGTQLDVTAQTVTLEQNTHLDVPSLMLAATETVTVKSGASINNTGDAGTQDPVLNVTGDGALLRASSAGQLSIHRSNEPGLLGDLTVEAGASIAAGRSMVLDASHNTTVNGELQMVGGSLNLGASRISLGAVTGSPTGLVLDTTDLNRLTVDELVLTSRSSVDLYGDLDLDFSNLAIEAAAIAGYQQAGENVHLHADSFRLGNPSTAISSVTATGTGDLTVNAGHVELADGSMALRGFNNVSLQSDGDITLAGSGALNVEGSTGLTLDGRITASQRRAEYSINANNALLATQNSAAETATRSEALASDLTLQAVKIVHQGVIDLASGHVTLHAAGSDSNDDVLLVDGSVINVAGVARDFAGETHYSSGGDITLLADHGSVNQQAGAVLNVSGGGGVAAAGSLKTTAALGSVELAGTLLATHGTAVEGGRFVVDAQTLNDFSSLNQQLNNNGFDQQRHIRLRQGDIALEANEVVVAHDVELAADTGNVIINGVIDASGEQAGLVHLAARDNVALNAGAVIDAQATAVDERGGQVFIETREGELNLAAGSAIHVDGTSRGGEIKLRAPRTLTNDGIQITSVAAGMTGFERLDVEGFRSYIAGTTLDATDFTAAYNDATVFMTHDIIGGLDFSVALGNVHLRPGLEFTNTGNITFSASQDFFTRRYSNNGHDEAAVLTVLAGDNLNINASLSDGFAEDPFISGVFGLYFDRLQHGESWSYRLVAGADLAAASVMATKTNNSSDITLAASQKIRTGTGDIELASADQLVLGDGAAIYTAGESPQYTFGESFARGSMDIDIGSLGPDYVDYAGLSALDYFVMPFVAFPEHGGDIVINAAGDVTGANDSYLITNWLHRVGNPVREIPGRGQLATSWGIDFQYFNNGIGTLGGGDLTLNAGGNIKDLVLASPTTGKQVGDVTLDSEFIFHVAQNSVQVLGQGDINLQAAGDIERSMVYVGNGNLDITAGGNIGNNMDDSGVMLAMENTQANITARGDVYVQGVVNPGLMPLSQNQTSNLDNIGNSIDANDVYSFFSTYSQASGLNVQSVGGDLVLRNKLVAADSWLAGYLSSTAALASQAKNNAANILSVGDVNVMAFDGDLRIENNMTLMPTATGNLSLMANGNITTAGSDVQIAMLDQDPAQIANMNNPALSLDRLTNPDLGALNVNAHAAQALHMGDTQVSRIVAREGDIAAEQETLSFSFILPKAVEMIAGRDIVGIQLQVQNLNATDVSLVRAGRDMRFVDGTQYAVNPPTNRIVIGGPGELQVIAGRDIDLGDREGILSVGNNVNPALPDSGADVFVMAGVDGDAAYTDFINRYFTANSAYSTDLIDYMNQRHFSFASDEFDAALAAFYASGVTQQRSLVMQSFFKEITASASRAAAEQNNKLDAGDTERFGYSRGLDAIATLFPASVLERRVANAGETNSGNTIVTGGYAYTLDPIPARHGDVSLISSTISTYDDDSNLNVLIPGGLLNVGLTIATNDSKEKPIGLMTFGNSDVNIYTLGDVAVNESRIQSLNGGDMSIWSSLGDIDAGRGAKSVLNKPQPILILDEQQNRIYQEFPAVVQGSGIRGACFDAGCEGGDIVLAAPAGVIDAGDAGINSAGNITLATDTVLNAGNIEAGGDSVGFTTETTAMGLDLGNLSSVGGDSTSTVAGEDAVEAFSNAAVAILQVEVMGLEEDEKDNP
jgi:filamentous hemagglutinin family protein